MFLRITTLLLLISATAMGGHAQEKVWSLQECIEYASVNSLAMKQAEFGVGLAELSEKQSKLSRLPSVNSNLSGGWQFGRTIDPTTNLFRTDATFAGRIGIDAGVILYNGNRINNSVKQSKLDLEAAQLDAQTVINDLSLQIAQTYLSVLLAEEQLDNARQAVALSQEQLEITDKQIRAGTLPENARLDFLAQVALDEQIVIDAANQVEINLLTLKNLLELDPEAPFAIERPEDITLPQGVDAYRFGQVYPTALNTQPQIRAGEARLASSRMQENIARSGMLPTVSLFGNISTNYSSLAQDFNNPNLDNAELVPGNPKPILLELENVPPPLPGDPVPAQLTEFSLDGVTFPDVPFGRQIKNNFGQSVGLSVSIPIYNNHQNKLAVERARLQTLNQEVANLQAKQQLKTDVQRAVANAEASQRNLEAAQRSMEAAETAFENAQKRYDLGVVNSLEYLTARNTRDRARISMTQARYQYLFDLKVVDFYLGRELTLD